MPASRERLVLDSAAQLAVMVAPHTASAPHAQWGVAVLVGLDGDVRVESSAGTVRGAVVIVPAGITHVTRSRGPIVSVVLDADHHRAAQLAARGRIAVVARSAPTVAGELVRTAEVARVARALVDQFLPAGHVPIADRRIARIMNDVDASSQAAIAARYRISPSHLSTLFRTHVGITLRAWLTWRRALAGLAAMQVGRLAHAAATAGFADHAHLTRTLTERLGYGPGRLAHARAP